MLEFLVLEFQEEEKSESLPDGACEAGFLLYVSCWEFRNTVDGRNPAIDR